MRGLSVRWSLKDGEAALAQELRDYVAQTSYDRFAGKPGLAYKVWRMVPGEWFEGTYVFENAAAREDFQRTFTEAAATSPVSALVGVAPVSIEAFEVVAVVAGEAGFTEAPRGESV